MKIFSQLLSALTTRERNIFIVLLLLFVIALGTRSIIAVQKYTEYVPVRGGEYHEGIVGQPTTINPIYSGNSIDHDISALLFSKLGDLIETWSGDDSGTVFTVNLKEDLVWDDGAPLTSDDVIFTIHTVQDPKTDSIFFKNWQGAGVERISELQIRIALPAPYVFFGENIERLPIIPKHIFGSIPVENMLLSSYNLEPVGSGPFKFESLSQKKSGFISEYRLVPNKLYQGEEPYLDAFSFRFFENRDDLISAVRAREVDGFGSLTPSDSDLVSSIPHMVFTEMSMPRIYSIFFNPNNNPVLQKKSVRLALSLSIPKEDIAKSVSDYAKIAEGPFGEPFEENREDVLQYDPDFARELLEGEDISLSLVVPDMPFLTSVAEKIREAWLGVGVSKVSIIPLKPGEIFDTVIEPNNYELLLFGNILEISEDLFPFWHSSQRIYPGLNLAFYKNEKVDKLIESIRETRDEGERKDMLVLLEAYILDDVPALFLFSLPYTYIHTDSLGGVDGKLPVIKPADRFKNVERWYIKRARVFK